MRKRYGFSSLARQYYFWIAGALFFAWFFNSVFLAPIEGLFFDWRGYLTTRSDLDPKIIVTGIDQGSIDGNPDLRVKGLGSWPWPRSVWARFLQEARRDGVKLVVFDLFFPDRRSGDFAFAQELGKGPPVIFAFQIRGAPLPSQPARLLKPIPIFKEKAADLGFANADFVNETVRSLPLVARQEPGGPYLPSLDLAVVKFILGNPPLVVKPNEVKLGNDTWPTSGNNHEFFLRWANPPASRFSSTIVERGIDPHNYISVLDMFLYSKSQRWREHLKGKILLVGVADPSLQDEARTPVDIRYGVVIHANMVNALLKHQFYRDAGAWWNAFFLFLSGFFLSIFLKDSGATKGAFLTFISIFLYTILNFFFFAHGLWLNLAGPGLSMVFVYVGNTAYHRFESERKRIQILKVYGRYVAPQVRKELLKEYEAEERKAELQGAAREVTVLESDIRGFTRLSESLSAEEVVHFLNLYFTAMIPILYKHGGTWDKFIGDAILAYFGAPVFQSDHAARGVACAMEMLQFIAKMRGTGEIPFQVGIGVHTGIVKVGHIGADATENSEEQKQFTIIGDTVNLTSRLCGRAEGGTILLSKTTYDALPEKRGAELIGPVLLKGKSEEVFVYRISPEERGTFGSSVSGSAPSKKA